MVDSSANRTPSSTPKGLSSTSRPFSSLSLRAPGKMMWLGEYAVLEGAPAVVAAVDRFAHVRALRHVGGPLRFLAPGVLKTPFSFSSASRLSAPRGSELIVAMIDQARSMGYTVLERGLDVHIDSSELSSDTKLGLGSSGAVAGGLAALILRLQSEPPSGVKAREALLSLALEGHHRFQGRVGSGSDVIASCLGGVSRVQAGTVQAIPVPDDIEMQAFFTGESAHTPTMVRALKGWISEDRAARHRYLDELAQTAERGTEALIAARGADFLASVDEYYEREKLLSAKSGVPIVNEAVEHVVTSLRSAGWSAKPSGAGGGDVVVAFRLTPSSPENCDGLSVEGRHPSKGSARDCSEILSDFGGQVPLGLSVTHEGLLSQL